jgi:hypothetical protein
LETLAGPLDRSLCVGSARLHRPGRYVYGTALLADYTVTAKDAAAVGPHGLAWRRAYGDPFDRTPTLVPYGAQGAPLSLPFAAQPSADAWGEYTLWRTAPTSCSGTGWALLGELDKFISISAQRVTSVAQHCGGADEGNSLVVGLAGASHEAVAISFATADGKRVEVVKVVLDASGKGQAAVGR